MPTTLPLATAGPSRPHARTASERAPGPASLAEDPDLGPRLADLSARLAGLDSLLVAFSGGADSTLVVAAAARALGPGRVLAATGDSASLSERERAAVRTIA